MFKKEKYDSKSLEQISIEIEEKRNELIKMNGEGYKKFIVPIKHWLSYNIPFIKNKEQSVVREKLRLSLSDSKAKFDKLSQRRSDLNRRIGFGFFSTILKIGFYVTVAYIVGYVTHAQIYNTKTNKIIEKLEKDRLKKEVLIKKLIDEYNDKHPYNQLSYPINNELKIPIKDGIVKDNEWLDYLPKKGLIKDDSKKDETLPHFPSQGLTRDK